jgi:hypothetical protein
VTHPARFSSSIHAFNPVNASPMPELPEEKWKDAAARRASFELALEPDPGDPMTEDGLTELRQLINSRQSSKDPVAEVGSVRPH